MMDGKYGTSHLQLASCVTVQAREKNVGEERNGLAQ